MNMGQKLETCFGLAAVGLQHAQRAARSAERTELREWRWWCGERERTNHDFRALEGGG